MSVSRCPTFQQCDDINEGDVEIYYYEFLMITIPKFPKEIYILSETYK